MSPFFSLTIQLLASLSILVFIHELGHFLFARKFKVRVEKFYLFFDPWFSLFKYKPRGSDTEYGIGWLPLGGYCKISGMIDESLDTDQMASEPQPYEFRSKPAWQRLLIMFAGVLFNAILAIFIYTGISLAWGKIQLPSENIHSGMAFSDVAKDIGFQDNDIIIAVDGQKEDALDRGFMRKIIQAQDVEVLRNGQKVTIDIPSDMMERLLRTNNGLMSIQFPLVIDSVMKTGGASQAQLLPGDSLVAIDSTSVPDVRDALTKMNSLRGNESVFTFARNGELFTTPVKIDTAGHIGIVMKRVTDVYKTNHISYNIFNAIPAGIDQGMGTMKSYVGDMKYVFTKEGAKQMGGFGTIGKLFPYPFNWHDFWSITAFLSIILAVMNLLPIPGLDGGHIMFLFIEMISGRKVSQKILVTAQVIGMLLLFALVLYANGNDLFRYLIK
ncbi:RIP metalloprotease RseP [Porphyromonas pogonae]|uniref:RIP metalloprotease RseP n=1 Tax=Porphyromonas pogonae TaxID=867595 RepID=UPI002E78E50A|nr:RIP metalloprotease RseP [Porphyromonas pogonae]